MNKFDKINHQITQAREKESRVLRLPDKLAKVVYRDHLATNKAKVLRKDKARFDKVSPMRGDKYGYTFTRQHGSIDYRVVGEPCLTCGRDHHYHGKE